MQGLLVAAVAAVPLVFDVRIHNVFEFPQGLLLKLLAAGMVAAAAIGVLRGRPLAWRRTPLDLPIAIFLGIQAAACLVARKPGEALDLWLLWAAGAVLYRATVQSADGLPAGGAASVIRRILHAVLVSAAAYGAYGLAQYLGWDVVAWQMEWSGGRIQSSLGNPDFLAAMLVGVLPVAAAISLDPGESRLWRRFAAGLALLLGLDLLLTQVRGAYLAALMSAGTGAAMWAGSNPVRTRPGAGWRRAGILAGTAAAAILAAAVFSTDNPLNRRGTRLIQRTVAIFNLKERSASDRWFQWVTATLMVRAHPVLGVGPGNFGSEFFGYQKLLRVEPRYAQAFYMDAGHCHNEFLEIAAESGLAGLGAFLLILGTAAWRVRFSPASPRVVGLVAGLVGLLAHSVTMFPLRLPASGMLFWLYLGLLMRGGAESPAYSLDSRAFQARRAGSGSARTRQKTLALAVLALAVIVAIFQVRLYAASRAFREGRLAAGLKSREGWEASLSSYADARRLAGRLGPDWRVTFYQARSLDAMGRKSESLEAYGDDLVRNPSNAVAHYNRGTVLQAMGRLDEASADYEEALRVNPWDVSSAVNLAVTRGLQGRRGEARRVLEAALVRNPSSAEAHLNLGVLAWYDGDFAAARASLERGLQLDPGNAQGRTILDRVRRGIRP